MMQKIDGSYIVNQVLKPKLVEQVSKLKKQGLPKLLAIIVTSDAPEIHSYITAKQHFFESIGLPLTIITPKPTKQEVLNWINKLNNDEQVVGILIQLPLHKDLQAYKDEFFNAITPQKDVEGLSNYNLGLLVQGQNAPLSPAVCGIIKALEYYQIDWQHMHWGIIGAGTLIGKPLSAFLTGKKASFTLLDLANPNYTILQQVDILVTATGTNMRPVIFNVAKDLLKEQVILIDAGTYYKDNQIQSDLNLPINEEEFNQLPQDIQKIMQQKVKLYTPKLGSLGPLTVYCLAEGVVGLNL